MKGVNSSVVTIHGPREVAESFPLAGPSRGLHLIAPEVAAAPVIEDREAGKRCERLRLGDVAAFPANDRPQLQLVNRSWYLRGRVGHVLILDRKCARG